MVVEAGCRVVHRMTYGGARLPARLEMEMVMEMVMEGGSAGSRIIGGCISKGNTSRSMPPPERPWRPWRP